MRIVEALVVMALIVGLPGWGLWRVTGGQRRRLRAARAKADALRDRLATQTECLRVYVDADGAVRPGWLEEEIVASDKLLGDLKRRRT